MTIEREQEQDVVQFMNAHANTGLKLDVLRFWRKYPFAKFTSGIVARAVDCNRRLDVEETLECFVKAELLQKSVRQGLPFYQLTTADPSKRQCILNLPSASRGNVRPAYY